MRAEAGVGSVRKGRRSPARRDRLAVVRRRWKGIVAFVGVLLLAALVVGFAYSGSPDVVAAGVTVSGQDVGGLSAAEAARLAREDDEPASAGSSIAALMFDISMPVRSMALFRPGDQKSMVFRNLGVYPYGPISWR